MSARIDEHALREHGLNVAMRLVALLRTGRTYAIGNLAFQAQLKQLLEVLEPVLAELDAAQIVDYDGDLYFNGERLPLRPTNMRFLEQLQTELGLRLIAGIEFRAGLDASELQEFMRFFLASELYKGAELIEACTTAGFAHVTPAQGVALAEPAAAGGATGAATGAPIAEAPECYTRALLAHEQASADAARLLVNGAPMPGIEPRHLKRALLPLIEAALAGDAADAPLAWITRGPQSSIAHAVHTALLAARLGVLRGCDRAALARIAAAALLHDCGAPGPAHSSDGARRIARSVLLGRTTLLAIRAALTHHDTEPLADEELALVQLADAYVSLLASEDARALSCTPCETLGHVLAAFESRTPAALRAALVRAVGLYPAGQLVRLDDGAIVRVLANRGDDPERPYVEWLTDAQGVWLPDAGQGAIVALPAERRVAAALTYADYPALEDGERSA